MKNKNFFLFSTLIAFLFTNSTLSQEPNQDLFKSLKDLAKESELQKRFECVERHSKVVKKVEAFTKSISPDSVEIHLGRLAHDGVGFWTEYEKATGLLKKVMEVHEDYELSRLKDMKIPLEKRLSPKSKEFQKADAEARELERIYLACVARTEYPELHFRIWKSYCPSELYRFDNRNSGHSEYLITVTELLRLIEFGKNNDLGDKFIQLALKRFFFERCRSRVKVTMNEKQVRNEKVISRITRFVAQEASTLIKHKPSLESISATETICLQIQDCVSQILNAQDSTNTEKMTLSLIAGNASIDGITKTVQVFLHRKTEKFSLEFEIGGDGAMWADAPKSVGKKVINLNSEQFRKLLMHDAHQISKSLKGPKRKK